LYGFPESHAASFALIAYASAYLKCHYLAAFTAALLNNQPMGFYHPSTLVKDAQRHGLKVLPMDVTRSDWKCTLEPTCHPERGRTIREADRPAESKDPCAFLTASTLDFQDRCDNSIGQCEQRFGGRGPSTPQSHSLRERDCCAQDDNTRTELQTPNRHQKLKPNIALRLGLKYTRGLREPAGQALVRERSLAPFASVQDLVRRVPELRKDELTTLAEIGALNAVSREGLHRRGALWQVERAVRWSGPLLDELPEIDGESPLADMTYEERLIADFRSTGLTVGPHPMQYRRAEMKRMGIYRASDLAHLPNGRRLRIGGCVIARQRPGTAKGMMFMSLEDETGIANAIIAPDLLQKNRVLLISERFVMIEGILQNQDNVIHIRAERISALRITQAETASHDFH
jgi:DNA polymerase III alpha subunit